MATHDYIISNASGAAVRADLNNALAAIATNNSSATEPTTTYAYQWWADTGSSPTVMKLRNAANSGWVTLFQLDGEWTVVPFENGTAAAPSIYFKDSGTDTGIYSPGTDQVAISTGGSQRLLIDSYGIVTPGGGVFSGGVSSYAVNGLVLNFSSPFSEIRACRAGGNYGGLKFYTQGANSSGAQAERMTITTEGLVGIGTASAASYSTYGNKLVVYGTGTDGPGMTIATGTSDTGSIYFADGTTGDQVARGAVQYAHASDALLFQAAATERARIDSSGRLLLGTSSSTAFTRAVVAGNSFDATGVLTVSNTGSSIADGGQLAELQFSDSEHGKVAAVIRTNRDGGTWSGTSKPTRLIFGTTADGATAPTERMRITNAGKILVNNGADTDAQAVIRTTSSLGGYNLYLDAINTYSTTYRFMRFRVTSSTSVVGEIVSNDGASTVYSTTSDYRLKENIAIIDNGIARFKQLKPCRFNFLVNPSQTVDGFIAHEVQEVVPEAITGDKDAVDADGNPIYQGIDQSKLVPLLTAALQEAVAKIETLEAKVAALEAN